jgi:hypothetical protein
MRSDMDLSRLKKTKNSWAFRLGRFYFMIWKPSKYFSLISWPIAGYSSARYFYNWHMHFLRMSIYIQFRMPKKWHVHESFTPENLDKCYARVCREMFEEANPRVPDVTGGAV